MILLSKLLSFAKWVANKVGMFWKKFTEITKRVVSKLEEKFKRPFFGVAPYMRKIGDELQSRTRHYSKDEAGKWKETIVTRTMNENEIPEEYLKNKPLDEDFDLSDELELLLANG